MLNIAYGFQIWKQRKVNPMKPWRNELQNWGRCTDSTWVGAALSPVGGCIVTLTAELEQDERDEEEVNNVWRQESQVFMIFEMIGFTACKISDSSA